MNCSQFTPPKASPQVSPQHNSSYMVQFLLLLPYCRKSMKLYLYLQFVLKLVFLTRYAHFIYFSFNIPLPNLYHAFAKKHINME